MAEAQITRWYGAQVLDLATKANVTAMKRATLEVERYVKTHFTVVGQDDLSRGERVSVRKTKKGLRHYRSLPGEPPAVDTGVLRASIATDIVKSMNHVDGFVGVADPMVGGTSGGPDYGLYLELGTSKMAPRPYLRPALAAMGRRISAIFKEANS